MADGKRKNHRVCVSHADISFPLQVDLMYAFSLVGVLFHYSPTTIIHYRHHLPLFVHCMIIASLNLFLFFSLSDVGLPLFSPVNVLCSLPPASPDFFEYSLGCHSIKWPPICCPFKVYAPAGGRSEKHLQARISAAGGVEVKKDLRMTGNKSGE